MRHTNGATSNLRQLPKAVILDCFSFESDEELLSCLLLSFSLDAEFFTYDFLRILLNVASDPASRETEYLAELRSRLERTQVTVVVNKKDYDEALDYLYQNILRQPSVLGYRLAGAPFRLFHPKLYLLIYRSRLDGKHCRARLVIGSANLTKQGMRQSAETFAVMELSERDQRYLGVFDEVQQFLALLMTRFNELHPTAVDDLSKLIELCRARGARHNQNIWFVHSLSAQSILSQIESRIGDSKITDVRVASPFFEDNSDSSTSLVRRLLEADGDGPYKNLNSLTIMFRAAKSQNKFVSRLPLGTLRSLSPSAISKLKLFPIEDLGGVDAENPRVQRFMHGKLIAIETTKHCFLIMGSPNFSNRALVLTGENANVETAVVFKLDSSKAFDLFPEQKAEIRIEDLLEEDRADPEEEQNSDLVLFVQDCFYDMKSRKLVVSFALGYEPKVDWKISLSDNELLAKGQLAQLPEARLIKQIDELADRYLLLTTPEEKLKIIIREEGVEVPILDSTYEELLLDLQGATSAASRHRAGRAEGNLRTIEKIEDEKIKYFFSAVNNLHGLLEMLLLDNYGSYRIEILLQKVERLYLELMKRHEAGERTAITLFKLAELAQAMAVGEYTGIPSRLKGVNMLRSRILTDARSIRSQSGFGKVESILNGPLLE